MRALQTTRLTLEPLEPRHAPEMFEVLSDPAIYEFENSPPPSIKALRMRYQRLACRRSPDGREQWLNWVVRLRDGPLVGYVQATVSASQTALIAYELNSRHWRQGVGRESVAAMIDELYAAYGATRIAAVFKMANVRSRGLLRCLSFIPASAAEAATLGCAFGEDAMIHRCD